MNLLGIPLVVFSLVAVQAPPEPKKDAPIDYEARLNDLLGNGITPDTNANVLLWKVFGPTPEGGRGMPAEFYKRLGIPEPPKDGDYFMGLGKYARDRLSLTDNQLSAVFEQQQAASQRPWAPKDHPVIADWLTFNEKHLAVVIEATKRPDYFNPLVSHKSDTEPSSLIGALLPSVQKCRELVGALTARAMLRLHEGKADEAWQDLLAAHRLGRLVSRGGTLIEGLVGIAINQIACNADLAYLAHAKLTTKQIQDRLKDLQSLPPMPSMADKIDLGERHMYFDTLQLVRRGGVGMLEGLADGQGKKPTPDELKALAMIDWEPAMKNGDKLYARMSAAMRLQDRAAREKEFDKIDADLQAVKKDAVNHAQILADVTAGKDPGKNVSKVISDILIGLLMPAVRKVQSAHDRNTQVERNLHVAFALAAYHRDNGRYPTKLDDLAPKYIAAVTNDLFAGKPLIYKPAEKGYLVYSIGANGKDEGGRWYDDEPPGDDPRVRMPLPEPKKP